MDLPGSAATGQRVRRRNRPPNHPRLEQLLCIPHSRCALRDANGGFNMQPFAPDLGGATTGWVRKAARTGR